MELIKGIKIPVVADPILAPEFYYGDRAVPGIYFKTDDELFGRITFYNQDAIRVCRGELMPYDYNWDNYERGTWIYKIENSGWLGERFQYEHKNYGSSYEFNGNVNEMLTDFNHYLFWFHDQFIEVIARGFWYEESTGDLFGRELRPGHPFLPLHEAGEQKIVAHNLSCQVRVNTKPIDEIIENTECCPQKLFEFALELEGRASVGNTVILMQKNGELISSLRGFFSEQLVEFKGVATLEQVTPYIESHMGEVYERRKAMGK